MAALRQIVPGFLVVAALAVAAWLAGPIVRLEAALIALVIGIAVGALARHPRVLEEGARRTQTVSLTAGVILLGAEVNLAFLSEAGPRAIVLALVLVPFTLGAFLALGRLVRAEGDVWALLGMGTAICGVSAVVAAGSTLRSRDRDVAMAAAVVGILSAVGLVIYPLVGLVIDIQPEAFGAWSGLGIHAVANAVGAGVTAGPEAGRVAALTKLARVALLAPTLVVLALLMRRGARLEASRHALVPPIVWGFFAASIVASVVPLPTPLMEAIRVASRVLLVGGMAGLGYVTRLGYVRGAGARAMAIAVAGWIVLSIAALTGAALLYR